VENLFLREPLDVTIESQKFLSCVARFQQRKELFGIDYTIQFLCGSCHLEEGHNELSTYGIGRDKEKIFWETLCSILLTNNFVENNYIQIAEGHKRPVLNLNDSSWEILKGNISVVVVSESWRFSLRESKSLQNIKREFEQNKRERRDYYDNEESSMDIDGYDFSQGDSIMDTYDSYAEEIDYGYLSDIENYDAY
jgi:superfamily II DNA helicase RecQ